MSSSRPVRLVQPDDRVEADPTPGMRRERAIEVEGLWAGLVRTAPGMTSGWHHHGDYETSIYVADGSLRMESGPSGAEVITAIAGDFLHVPKGAIHRESNDGDQESHLIVVRAGRGVPTVNVDGPARGLMEVRRAGPEDSLPIAEVWMRSRRASVPAIPAPVHSEDEIRSWFADVVLPDREVWIAQDDGLIVAVLVLDRDWVDQLYVAPEWTGAGIGSRLVDLAKERRPTGLQLWTFQANAGARRFYERHQFVAVQSTDGDNEEGAPDVRYEWRPD